MLNDLREKYTGRLARDYEKNRTGSWKWRFENDAIIDLLREVFRSGESIDSVLDIPCGTGRLTDILRDVGLLGCTTGIDCSVEMLAQAQDKGMTVERGDFFGELRSADLVFCIRFINWLGNLSAIQSAFRRLRLMTRKYIILTITTQSNGNYYHGSINSKKAFIPCKNALNATIDSTGLEVISKRIHKTDNSREMWVCLLKKK